MGLIKEIFAYSISPFFTTERDKFSLISLIKLVTLNFGLAFLLSNFLEFVTQTELLSSIELKENYEQFIRLENILLIVVFYPIYEELIFRAWLGSRKGIVVALPIIMLFYLYLESWSIEILLAIILLLFAIILFIARSFRLNKLVFHVSFFRFYYWFSCFSFALVHISNFQISSFTYATILALFPYFMSGLIYGYTRMRFGVIPSIFVHANHNLLALFLWVAIAQ